MSFTPNMPELLQSLGNSRQKVVDNFAILRKAAGSDSVSIGDHYDVNGANIGKHKWVHLPAVGVSPGVPTTAVLEGALYTKDVGGGVTDLFYRRQSNGAEIRITGGTAAANGTAFLGDGVMMQWGSNNPATTISFNTPFGVAFTPVVTITSFTSGSAQAISVTAVTNANFSVNTPSVGLVKINWMAIGPSP